MCSPVSGVLWVLCCLPPDSYVAVFCVVTCRPMKYRDHFVVMQPHKSKAPFEHAFDSAEQESSRTNLFRPCQMCQRGTTPLDRDSTVDEDVW